MKHGPREGVAAHLKCAECTCTEATQTCKHWMYPDTWQLSLSPVDGGTKVVVRREDKAAGWDFNVRPCPPAPVRTAVLVYLD